MKNQSIRPITESDSANMLRWRNLPDIRKYMYTDHIITQEEHDNWFRGLLADKGRREYFIYVVDGKDVGMLGFTEINKTHGTATFAYYIGESVPKGSGQVLEQIALNYAFAVLNLRKLKCEVISSNERVLHIHKKFGFKVEGILREEIIKDDHPLDVIILGILKSEWIDKIIELDFQEIIS